MKKVKVKIINDMENLENEECDNAMGSTAQLQVDDKAMHNAQCIMHNDCESRERVLLDDNVDSIATECNREKLLDNQLSKKIETQQPEDSKFGKFVSGEALYSAYRALESEFTKKAQENSKLKQVVIDLENSAFAEENFVEKAAQTREVIERVVKDYLNSKLKNATTVAIPVLTSKLGQAAAARVVKPKTLEEAGRLAAKLLR